MRRPRVSPSSVRVVGALLACGAALAACKGDRTKPEDPHSLASLEQEGPPHTSDCRSWDDLDVEGLPALAEAPHMAAFDQVWRTVAHKHYDPTLACLDWPKIREQYAAKVAEAGEDTAAAYAAINEMLGLLGQSHLHATAPTRSSTRKREGGPATVPITVRWLPLEPKGEDHGAVVTEAEVDGHPSGLPQGAVLTEVAGESITELVAETRGVIEARGGRPAEVDFMITQAIAATLSCPEGGTKELSFRDAEDQAQTLEAPCFLPEGKRISLGNLRNLPTTVRWRMIPAEPNPAEPPLGYLAFNYWMLPMVEDIRAGVEQMGAQGMQGLIIDLRGNPGGVGAMSIPVARMFLREGASLGRLQMREFNQEFKIEPNPEAFDEPIAILIDESTASTSEIFAVGMRDIGRVTIVGAGPSAGMALPSMIESLPDGGLIQYVVGDYHSARGTVAEGEGVAPDEVVEESRADYAGGKDPALDAAAALLRARVRDSAPDP